MKKVYSVPNLLSLLRIAIIPVYMYLYILKYFEIALVILILSGITDFVDGLIARKFNMITEIGKMLDPLADKLTQISVVICATITYPKILPFLILLVSKELAMIACSFFLWKRGFRPSESKWYGKLATAVFYGGMLLILIDNFKNILPDFYVVVILIITSVCAVYAAIRYLLIFKKSYTDIKQQI